MVSMLAGLVGGSVGMWWTFSVEVYVRVVIYLLVIGE
jgi:hypothetical protein